MDQLFYIQIAIALLLFTQAKSTTETSVHANNTITRCIPRERSALLAFRAGLSEPEDLSGPANLLSSWKGDDCCQWKGVYCGSRTGHVVKLDLRGMGCEVGGGSKQVLAGNLSSSLLGLQHLAYLDLSCNRFNKIQIPEFMGSLHKLRYLDLSRSSFIGRIPPQLGNLSNLIHLILGFPPYRTLYDTFYNGTYSTDITWLSQLISLEYLDMSEVNLSTIVHWLPVVNMLPTLKVLRLSMCHLRSCPGSLQLSNLTALEELDLSGNEFHQHSTSNWFWDLTRLQYLDISNNDFYGPFPDEIGNMTSMAQLYLSNNYFVGIIPSNMKNLCNLKRFDAYGNNINGGITEIFHQLPRCSQNKLEVLTLAGNNLAGSLPTTPVESLRNLRWLYISYNQLTGHVPLWIGELTRLKRLDLSINNLDGIMHEGHLSRLNMLEDLTLSGNSITITVSPTWVPPFSLRMIHLRSCQLGPKFPTWLRWQIQAESLDISNTSINDMVPDWFWIAASSAEYLNIQKNHITGVLPSIMEFMRGKEMDFSSNQLGGPIPKLPINLTSLDLSRNNVVGPLPLDFGAPGLTTLLLSDNMISGGMTQIRNSSDDLQFIFTSVSGEWYDGDGLVEYTERFTVLTKGQERLYAGEILYMVNLDLSCNSLAGEIPAEISTLVELKNLNLSWNYFNGKIPENIGALMKVESLDLSQNELSGEIPYSLSALTSLSRLNLSYNNLSGRIPSGNQLQALEDPESIYVGNPGLCGLPLSQKCSSQPEEIRKHHEDASDNAVSFFPAMDSGYVMGLWVVFCTLLFKRRWRVSWYSLSDALYDRVYVQVAVTWASWRGTINE